MLKGIEFIRKNSRGFKTLPHTLSSLRAQRSNDEKQGEAGRSMVEMLGVLAIIAVLSVGGIAGYSKAMEKFKLNKLISEYSMFLYNLTEHEDELHKFAHNMGQYSATITDTIYAMNLVPDTWKKNPFIYMTVLRILLLLLPRPKIAVVLRTAFP